MNIYRAARLLNEFSWLSDLLSEEVYEEFGDEIHDIFEQARSVYFDLIKSQGITEAEVFSESSSASNEEF